MLDNEHEMLEFFFQELSDELNVSKSNFDKFENSYNAVGKYLSENILDYDVEIFPQGSMKLGTTIKPINEEDDYDLDAVCVVKTIFSKQYCKKAEKLSARDLKNLVGDVLKSSDRYKKLLNPKEGKRCWTLKYSEDTNFHMDILPATILNPNNDELRITNKNKNTGEYSDLSSNPIAYAKWFANLQIYEIKKIKESYAAISPVPKFIDRTTLQKTVQILKRHRDIMFSNDIENKPISIIITTLVAHCYNDSTLTIVDLIKSFLKNYNRYVKNKNGALWIENPVDPRENFADKWKTNPKLKDNFDIWISKLNRDFSTFEIKFFTDELISLAEKADLLSVSFGDSTIRNVFVNLGSKIRKLREGGNLYSTNSSLTLDKEKSVSKVPNHTFYGQ